MHIILNKELRKKLSNSLRKFRKSNKGNPNQLKLKDIDTISEVIISSRKEANIEISKDIRKELEIAYLCVHSISLLALLFSDRRKNNILPQDYFDKYNVPSVNLLVGNILTLISNHSLSIIQLLENGMDWSSRPILRTLSELSALFIVILAIPEKAKIYMNPQNEQEERIIWFKNFTPNKLKKLLIQIKEEDKIEGETIELFNELFEHLHSFYTQTTHTASIVSIVGAFSSGKRETLNYALWGRYSLSIESRLLDLTHIIFFTTEIFLSILDKYYQITLSNEKYFAALFNSIYDCLLGMIKDFTKKMLKDNSTDCVYTIDIFLRFWDLGHREKYSFSKIFYRE
jgi:hypothetical protein